MTPPGSAYDVVVVGAGVVGCAIARELARYPVRVALLEASDDVGDATSKANTAIWHTGFDAPPGSLEAGLVARGHRLLGDYASAAGIPLLATGALLVAWDDEQESALPRLAEKARANGYTRTRPVTVAELYEREPHLAPGARGALEVPDEGIVCPWTTTLAYATEALRGGVELRLRTAVTGVDGRDDGVTTLRTGAGPVRTRFVVNAAGLSSDLVDRMFGHDGFSVTPRRGELIVFDKLAAPLVQHVLLPVPSSMGKGVLVAPTVYGNVMLGPTAEDLRDRTDTASSREGLDFLRRKGRALVPELLQHEVTAVYAGLRAATEHPDYQVRADTGSGYVCAGGIRSTGLTSSMALAEHVVGLLGEIGLPLSGVRDPRPPAMPNIGELAPRPHQRADLIAADPAYGDIVCHCERVTLGEIRDALRATVPPATLEGLRRRTRAQLGRCQGFYCGPRVRHLLESRAGAVPSGPVGAA